MNQILERQYDRLEHRMQRLQSERSRAIEYCRAEIAEAEKVIRPELNCHECSPVDARARAVRAHLRAVLRILESPAQTESP